MADLSDDLQEAWERLRETAAGFGDQRIYASHKSIMFARKSCYAFVRPKRQMLELCFFLGRPVNAAQIRRVDRTSKTKLVRFVHVKHRDEVEAPLTDWLQEAYDFAAPAVAPAAETPAKKKPAAARSKRSGGGKAGPVKKRKKPRAAKATRTAVTARRAAPARSKKG